MIYQWFHKTQIRCTDESWTKQHWFDLLATLEQSGFKCPAKEHPTGGDWEAKVLLFYLHAHIFPAGSGVKTLSQLHISNLGGQCCPHFYLRDKAFVNEATVEWRMNSHLVFRPQFKMDLEFVRWIFFLIQDISCHVTEFPGKSLKLYVCVYTVYMCLLLWQSKHMFLCICLCMCGPNGMPQAKPPLGHHGQTDLFNNTNKNQ